jgi:hypothetical protein
MLLMLKYPGLVSSILCKCHSPSGLKSYVCCQMPLFLLKLYPLVLVITDHFTRYAQAIVTKNQTARTTADALFTTS